MTLPFWKVDLPVSSSKQQEQQFVNDNTIVNLNYDPCFVGSPAEVVTSLSWSSDSQWLACTTWAKQIRLWQIFNHSERRHAPRYTLPCSTPTMSSVWATEHDLFVSSLDGAVGHMKLSETSINLTNIYNHVATTSCLAKITHPSATFPILVSGSWDHTFKLYDVRANKLIHNQFASDEILTMDAREHLIVIGTADKDVTTWDCRKLSRAMYILELTNSLQNRSLALMNTLEGYVQGSVNGRCNVTYYEKEKQGEPSRNYAFKSHVTKPSPHIDELHAVNALAYHPIELNVLASAGSDGRFRLWNTKEQRQIRTPRQALTMPITAFQWSPNGLSAAYAVGNDFSRGTKNSFSRIYWYSYQQQEEQQQDEKQQQHFSHTTTTRKRK